MKRHVIPGGGGAAPILMLFLLLVVACNTSNSVPTDDATTLCAGRCGMVEGVQCGPCGYGYACNEKGYCVEIEGNESESVGRSEEESSPDEEKDEHPDTDCPDLRVYENVKKAGFPFKDRNGKITFCRPGCDTPTENDPQCVRNIMEWQNWRHYSDYLSGKNGIGYNYPECYPWPCVLPGVKAQKISYSPCDRDLTSAAFQADMGTLYDLRVEKEHIGIEMYNAVSMRTLLYSIEKDEFMVISASGTSSGYKNERFIFYLTTNDPNIYRDEGLGLSYILSAKKTATGYRYEVIYDDEEHMAWFSRPPLVGDQWVVLNVEHRATGKNEVVYSKVDEWNWRPLIYSKVYEGNVVNNYLTFINSNREIYVCDLEKLPYDPAKECIRIDRDGENPYRPRLNEENKNQLVYSTGVNGFVLTLVDISKNPPVYEDISITPSDPQSILVGAEQWKGNVLLYVETFMPPNETTRKDYKACFYRIDTKKQYCPTTPSFKDGRYDMGFNSFDGNYQLWKAPASINARFRDIQCYCAKEGVCPFEGLRKKLFPWPTLNIIFPHEEKGVPQREAPLCVDFLRRRS